MRAVLFDLDGTLLNRDASLIKFVNNQYERYRHKLNPVSKERYLSRFIELDQRGYVWKDRVYQQMLQEFGIEEQLWEELLDDYEKGFCCCCVPFPNMHEMLNRLQQSGFQLGLITNARGHFQMRNIRALDLERHFRVISISEWGGLRKPESAIFRKALSRLEVSAEESVYVGDHPVNDIEGAQGAGMKAIWKRDPLFPPPNRPDGIVDDLLEIPGMVEQWR